MCAPLGVDPPFKMVDTDFGKCVLFFRNLFLDWPKIDIYYGCRAMAPILACCPKWLCCFLSESSIPPILGFDLEHSLKLPLEQYT